MVFLSKEFLSFLFMGGIAAFANFTSRFVYSLFFSFPYAVSFAYITGMITAFFLFRAFVFIESKNTLSKSIKLFIIVNIFSFVQTWFFSIVLAFYILPSIGIQEFDKAIASAIGISIPAFSSFIGHKYFTFNESAT